MSNWWTLLGTILGALTLNILANLLTDLLKQRGGQWAQAFVRGFGRLLSPTLRHHYVEPWVADISVTPGTRAKLKLALTFLRSALMIGLHRTGKRHNLIPLVLALMPWTLLLSPTGVQLALVAVGLGGISLLARLRLYRVIRVSRPWLRSVLLSLLLPLISLLTGLVNGLTSELNGVVLALQITSLVMGGAAMAVHTRYMVRLTDVAEETQSIALALQRSNNTLDAEEMAVSAALMEEIRRLQVRQSKMAQRL